MSALDTPQRAYAWIPWVFAGGMLVVVAVNGSLVYFAFASWYGLATDHAYERGRTYNKVLDASERQEALGWALKAALRPAPGGADLVVTFSDRTGRMLEGLAVTAALERPVGQPERRQITLTMERPGWYAGHLPGIQHGQWNSRIEAAGPDARIVAAQRLVLP